MAYLELFLSYVDIKTALTFFVVFFLVFNALRQRMNLPPGPMSLPLIGNLPSLVFNLLRSGDEPEHLLAKMAKTYGDVFSLKVGNRVVVVCNGYKSIKEAFHNPFMNDRPQSRVFEETSLDEGKFMRRSWFAVFKHQSCLLQKGQHWQNPNWNFISLHAMVTTILFIKLTLFSKITDELHFCTTEI